MVWTPLGPCPCLGANGISASLMVVSLFVKRVLTPAGLTGKDHDAANAKMEEVGRLCCWLGDEEMYRIWSECPPEGYKTKERNASTE